MNSSPLQAVLKTHCTTSGISPHFSEELDISPVAKAQLKDFWDQANSAIKTKHSDTIAAALWDLFWKLTPAQKLDTLTYANVALGDWTSDDEVVSSWLWISAQRFDEAGELDVFVWFVREIESSTTTKTNVARLIDKAKVKIGWSPFTIDWLDAPVEIDDLKRLIAAALSPLLKKIDSAEAVVDAFFLPNNDGALWWMLEQVNNTDESEIIE